MKSKNREILRHVAESIADRPEEYERAREAGESWSLEELMDSAGA